MKRIVEVHYYIKDGKRDDFYRTLMESGIADASRAEEGNEKYEYYYSPDNENELLLLEGWKSAETVELHQQSAHFKQLGELKKEYVTETAFMRYEIAE
ncbi:putative quinol monooxygenase [Ruminococcus flavefaciens]|uniref:putative quinol monooxygenase n=1 Tax=Ruminococcus flavefaciens TaxID=1265 RepID=UPI0026EE9569|nr:putative quinol monooxygenase [Ruminococcus flavefaciens]